MDVSQETTCDIKQGSQLAELLNKTSLIIWDEASMVNKLCFEALEKTLRNILRDKYENSADRPFGGLTLVCGGDLTNTTNYSKGTRSDIFDAALNSSPLWHFFSIYELKENMCLSPGKLTGTGPQKYQR